ncbi:Predicted arabinose efflux permease, MFS family [Arenibacter nanhaiticus]|uniref:Predicted arabinose efflux permease, MFS family n=1 Tax=Arenibacter nanhaiticus TaxID=558155 RepID=A0A1M6E986_9FLAO|nr:MFS transporter [Arenibacter nanhaiticus]SHI82046.1 Predicted arabinose efflux permease, MFS family [Arenibacter nanhaiticus]
MKIKPHILPVIIFSQFACTSIWFAGNVVVEDLMKVIGLDNQFTGIILSAVQFGFIVGTLLFATLMIADRYAPSKVFLLSAILAALCNLALLSNNLTQTTLLSARFGAGFFLAGIYPVGMKIASDYYRHGLGRALGFLVGALVLGTAFPHAIKGMDWGRNYTFVVSTTSILAVMGGCSMYLFIPKGPFRKKSTAFEIQASTKLFKIPSFRKAAFGYFGHMWELYAFWAFIPLAIQTYNTFNTYQIPIAIWTFTIIAIGSISCALGGYFSLKIGSKKVAIFSLSLSGVLCLLSPLFYLLSPPLFLLLLCIWGMAVISDSPQFSSMVAQSAPIHLKGTALTVVNCIGFSISIISIQLLSFLSPKIDPIYIFLLLGIGPIIGIWNLMQKTS